MRGEYAAEGWVRPSLSTTGGRPAVARSSLSRHSVARATWPRLPADGTRSAPGHAADCALACAPAGAASATAAGVDGRGTMRRGRAVVPFDEALPPHRKIGRLSAGRLTLDRPSSRRL